MKDLLFKFKVEGYLRLFQVNLELHHPTLRYQFRNYLFLKITEMQISLPLNLWFVPVD